MQDRSPPTRRNLLATHGRTIHMGQFLLKTDVRLVSAYRPITDVRRSAANSRNGPEGDIAKSEFQHAWHLFFRNVTRRQTVSFSWSRQHNTANSRKNAVALPNQPRQTSNEKYYCKWKRFGRSLRKTLRHEQLRAKLS